MKGREEGEESLFDHCLRFPPSRRPSTLDGCVRTLDHENVSSVCATTISATADSRVRQGNELAHRGQFSLNDNT